MAEKSRLILTLKNQLLIVLALFSLSAECTAQFQNRRRQMFQPQGDGTRFYLDRNGVPDWEEDEEFPSDVFTFVRIRYNAIQGDRGRWRTDYPDSDLNLSFRLQQLTSLKVNPDPIVLELTDKRLFNYPFVYFCEPGEVLVVVVDSEAMEA